MFYEEIQYTYTIIYILVGEYLRKKLELFGNETKSYTVDVKIILLINVPEVHLEM